MAKIFFTCVTYIMRILPILDRLIFFTSQRKLDDLYVDNHVHNFTQDDDECCSHDAKIRDAIRAHMYSQFLPAYGSEVGRSNKYAETLDDVYIPNLQKIGQNSYRGSTLAKNLQYLELLRKSNMNTVIDLVGYYDLENACKLKGIDYLRYPVSADFWANPIFRTDYDLKEEKFRELSKLGLSQQEFDSAMSKHDISVEYERHIFMKKFFKLIDVINKDGFYISCEYGEYRTPNILSLNTFFNPRWTGRKIYPTSEFVYEKFRNMSHNLTLDDKIRLGFNNGFEENLKIELGLADE